jgi:hypothetical protein
LSTSGDEILRRVTSGDSGAYLAVIEAQVKKLVRSGIPHPEGLAWNSRGVADDLVGDYCASPSYRAVVYSVANDDQLNALVYTALRNQLRARLRQTERARLRRRMKEIMAEEGYLEQPTKFWRRPGDPDRAFGGRIADLVEAAWVVEVRLVRWRAEAKRNSPVAERTAFKAVLGVALDAAGGAVHEDDLLEVVAQRFGVGPVSHVESLDVPEEVAASADDEPGPEDVTVAADEELEAAITAIAIWAQLSPFEQRLVLRLDDSARDAAAALEVGHTKANTGQRRLKEKLRVLIGDSDPERRSAVVAELRHLAQGADT